MESEKVKDIKECLKKESYIALEYFPKAGKPKLIKFKDILTLINEFESEKERLILQYERVKADSEMNCLELKDRIAELESENERLNKSDTSKENAMNEYYNLYKDFKRENQQLEKRIAELEKEKKELAKQVVKITGCSIDDISAQKECNAKLKQFGKKFELNIGKYLKKKYSDYQQDSFYYIVDKADVDMCLDETLKECLCDNNQ